MLDWGDVKTRAKYCSQLASTRQVHRTFLSGNCVQCVCSSMLWHWCHNPLPQHHLRRLQPTHRTA